MTVVDMRNKVICDLQEELHQPLYGNKDILLKTWIEICKDYCKITPKFKAWLKDKSNKTEDKEYAQYLFEIAERGYL